MEHDHPCYSIKPYITWFDFFTLTFVLQRGPTVIVRLSFIAVSQCLCICYMETSHLWMADPTAISSENAPIVIQIIEISLLFLLPNELKKKTQLSFAFLKIHGPYVRAHFALRLYQIWRLLHEQWIQGWEIIWLIEWLCTYLMRQNSHNQTLLRSCDYKCFCHIRKWFRKNCGREC